MCAMLLTGSIMLLCVFAGISCQELRCIEFCKPQDGECLTRKQTEDVLIKPTKYNRPLTRQEKSAFLDSYNNIGKIDKLCVCHKPHRVGMGGNCKQTCKTGFYGWLCLSKCMGSMQQCLEDFTACSSGAVGGKCEEEETTTVPDDEDDSDSEGEESGGMKIAPGTCSSMCKEPFGLCAPKEEILSNLKLIYGTLESRERTEIDKLTYFENTNLKRLEACQCLRTGFRGKNCKKKCPSGKGGYLCITTEQCEDFCQDAGQCKTIPEIRVAVQEKLGAGSLTRDHIDIIGRLEIFTSRARIGLKTACFCSKEDRTGRDCRDKCPPGYGGLMCVLKQGPAFAEAQVQAEYLESADYVNPDNTPEAIKAFQDKLKKKQTPSFVINYNNRIALEQELISKVRKYLLKRVHHSSVVDIDNIKAKGRWTFEDLDENDVKRWKRQDEDEPNGVDVEYTIAIPPAVARAPNFKDDLASAVRESGDDFRSKTLPGLALNKDSVTIRSVTVPETKEANSTNNYRIVSGVGIVLLAVTIIAVAAWLFSERSRYKRKQINRW